MVDTAVEINGLRSEIFIRARNFFFSFEIFVILGDIYHWPRRKFSKFSFSFFFVFTINFNLVINNL